MSTIYQKMVTHSQFFLHASPPDPTVSRILKRRLKVVQLSDACISHHTWPKKALPYHAPFRLFKLFYNSNLHHSSCEGTKTQEMLTKGPACNSPQDRLFAAATADSHRCPGNTPTWWMHLCFTSFAIILICALRSQQLYLNCRNPTMLHFQWESREIHIRFQLSERDSCLGMNFAVCTESRQATAVHGMTTSVQRTVQKTITSWAEVKTHQNPFEAATARSHCVRLCL